MTALVKNRKNVAARPFLKWAGGKTQLVAQMCACFPPELSQGGLKRYVEPFLGSGAVFFYLAQNFALEQFFIADANPEVVLAYTCVRQDVAGLIDQLSQWQSRYFALGSAQQAEFYYQTRQSFNANRPGFDFSVYNPHWLERAVQLIFLNRTCFNGLFRLNSRAEFNVPFGDYHNPSLCDAENLKAVSAILQSATIAGGDFELCRAFVDSETLVYFDPPYRPLSKTANFTAYARFGFAEAEQLRLARFYRELDKGQAKLMLSNSDPKNNDPADNFFEAAYAGYNIQRLRANRLINSQAEKRGQINELLITNY